MGIIQKWFNDPLEVTSIGAIDLRSDLERHIDTLGNFDRAVGSFSGEIRPRKAR
jgi:hypothetical protein